MLESHKLDMAMSSILNEDSESFVTNLTKIRNNFYLKYLIQFNLFTSPKDMYKKSVKLTNSKDESVSWESVDDNAIEKYRVILLTTYFSA